MAVSKNFENKDSKSERSEGGKQSGGSPFDVLGLLGMPKDMQNGIKSAVHNVEQAVDGLKHIVELAGKHSEQKPATVEAHITAANDGHQDFKRGSLLHGEVHNDNHQQGKLLGRLTHDETARPNPSHFAFLLKRLHEREAQHHNSDVVQQLQPMAIDQPQPQEHPATNWREANYAFRQNTADITLAGAKVLASGVIGAELNPNLGADEGKLRDMGLPYTRSVDKDMKPFFEHVIRPIMTRQPEQFHSQISNRGQDNHHSNLPYGGFQHHVQPNYYRADNSYYHQNQQQHLPYGGFQSHMQYYRRQS